MPNVYYIDSVLIDSEHAQTDIELNFIGLMFIVILTAAVYDCGGIVWLTMLSKQARYMVNIPK